MTASILNSVLLNLFVFLSGIVGNAVQSTAVVTMRKKVLRMQCFDQKLLSRKECSCGHPLNDATKCQTMPTQRHNGYGHTANV